MDSGGKGPQSTGMMDYVQAVLQTKATRIEREEWYEAENHKGKTQQAPQEKHTGK